MSGTTRWFPRHFWTAIFPKKEKRAKTWAPRLGLEDPEILLPDIRNHLTNNMGTPPDAFLRCKPYQTSSLLWSSELRSRSPLATHSHHNWQSSPEMLKVTTVWVVFTRRHNLWVFQRPLTPMLLQRYRDTNGSRIAIQIGGVYTLLSAKRRAYFCKSIAKGVGCVPSWPKILQNDSLKQLLL